MRFEQNGIVLWYGTPDAPAPSDLVPAGVSGRAIGLTVTVGVQPIAARNTVLVRYWKNGGAETRAQAWLARTDLHAKAQYFETRLPEFNVGETVEYSVECNCAGRQTPSPDQARKLVSSFKVVPGASLPASHRAVVTEGKLGIISEALPLEAPGALHPISGQERPVSPQAALPHLPDIAPVSPASAAKAAPPTVVTVASVAARATPIQPQTSAGVIAPSAPSSADIGAPVSAPAIGAPATGAPSPPPSATGPGTTSPTGPSVQPKELLRSVIRASSVLDAGALEDKFLGLYANRQGPIENFWAGLKQDSDLKNHVDQLQFALQLGLLTRNHTPLIQELRKIPGIASTRDLMKLDSAAWSDLVAKAGVPPGVPGADAQEGATNYAKAIVSVLRASFPTDAVAQIATKAQNVDPLVSKFFANSPDFEIRKSHVDKYVSDRASAAFNGIADPDRSMVVKEVKRLQRLFQVSANPDTLDGLLSSGLDSAHAIANIPRKSFLAQYGTALGGPQQAAQVYERAQFINARNLHLRTTIYEAINGLQTRAFGDPGSLKDDLIKRFPNYTELFGPLELCDCQECSSVLGTAAYLVDLFEFLGNSTPNAGGNTPLDVLIGNQEKNIAGRRPDLAYLPLTCENTNTTMPYVDLVNEVLESYITLGMSLDASTAHDTAGATAQELDANPQYTNVKPTRRFSRRSTPLRCRLTGRSPWLVGISTTWVAAGTR
jgi:hypothetical protein